MIWRAIFHSISSMHNPWFLEVKPPRNPGFNLYRRPGTPSLPRGTFTAIPSAKLPLKTKIYPVQLDIENSRVLGLVADQNGNPQNLDLILANTPASISSTTDSGIEQPSATIFIIL
ncbi:uncharacterized protein LOC106646428 [Copidosoma floridanum]|uniref:uncharacterized protein LOC106646428 n=1 Tax=Copidosoma floridanum TaxID=29053 RepID=UPI0006C98402|nr:uncharacterized protein LOC106646428 [Copidosoma floridanum]